MRYVDEFRSKKLVEKIAKNLKALPLPRHLKIMEVCGTHTQSFHKFGLDKLLPEKISLIAGPGCPVCVSAQGYIDNAIKLALKEDVIITSFGDMLRVPGKSSTLEKIRAESGNVRVVYSSLDSLRLAELNPDKRIVFLAVGFETTAPTIALSIISARQQKIRNLFFLTSLKLIPPAMGCLAKDPRLKLDGFLCPGHVSSVIGSRPYEFIVRRYHLGCCIAGFEPVDILQGIYLLVNQIINKRAQVTNQYSRVVKRNGNCRAQNTINKVFRATDTYWRGLGIIPKSGLKIREEFSEFDAYRVFSLSDVPGEASDKEKKCRCADILKGLISPLECPLFSKACRPDSPIGPCMVSSEGACNAYYKYR